MDFKEGMRRLALLVGLLGATLGCFVSYQFLRGDMEARARHKAFERLATSEMPEIRVQDEKGTILVFPDGSTLEMIAKALKERKILQTPKSDLKSELDASGAPKELKAQAWDAFYNSRTKDEFKANFDKILLPKETKAALWDMKFSISKYEIEPPTPESTVNKGGIKTIHWTKDLGVESIETEDGATLHPTPSPTLWSYLVDAIFPVLGFVVPWGSIRALAWVGAGFFEKSK